MNAQAPLPKPNDLKISCVLAEVIGLAETNPKDSRDLFDGVGTLNISLEAQILRKLVHPRHSKSCWRITGLKL